MGMDVVDGIGNVATDSNDKPLEGVRLIEALIIGWDLSVTESLLNDCRHNNSL